MFTKKHIKTISIRTQLIIKFTHLHILCNVVVLFDKILNIYFVGNKINPSFLIILFYPIFVLQAYYVIRMCHENQ